MKLSIVTTLYGSLPYLPEFYRRASKAARQLTDDYEIVLVNDGSVDDSLAFAMHLFETDSHVVVVDMSRNFGHHKAIMTGLNQARGDHVFLIDCDLEEPPELLGEFWQALHDRPDHDVVYGIQRSRKGGLMERLTGSLYYDVFNLLSNVKIQKNMSVVRLMTRRYINSLIQYREQEPVFAGLAVLAGYRQTALEFDKSSKGSTTYTFAKKLDMVANSLASFSNRPLVYIFYLGLAVTLSSFMLVAFYIGRYFLVGASLSGWLSLIVSVWIIGGLILLSLGLIGIYLAKMFSEVKNRPYSVIRAIHRREQ